MPTPGGTTARGYGAEHQRLRAALLPQAWGRPCTRCGQPLVPGQQVDLDHTDDRSAYQGFAHRHCNRKFGAKKGNAKRRKKKFPSFITSRDW